MTLNGDRMQRVLQFLEMLDRYAVGQLDADSFRRRIEEQAAESPRLLDPMMEGVLTAERAGEIDPRRAADVLQWLRSLQAVRAAAPHGSEQAEEPTRVTRRQADEAIAEHPAMPGSEPSMGSGIAEGTLLKGRYLLEEKVGEGGMGVVFRARDLEEERIARDQQSSGQKHYLAIKVLRADRSAYRNMVLEELRRTRVLVHQNIVRVGDCQQDGDLIFMTMEYLEGRPLDVLLAGHFAQGIQADRVWPIIKGIGEGLAYAHGKGLVHCDFKPSNVFVTYDFTPRILDFGIARVARTEGRASDAPVGMTRRYASPQMISAWDTNGMIGYQPDRRDDIFALAVVIYEVLTGAHPFGDGDALKAKQGGAAVAPIENLSPRQNRALARALSLDREARTGRVEDFLSEFLIPSDERTGQRASLAAAVEKRPRKHRIIALVAAALALVLALSYGLWKGFAGREVSLQARRASVPFHDCDECPAMLVIRPGRFDMGSPTTERGRSEDERLRPVLVPTAFALSVYPVTVRQYRAFVSATARHASGPCLDASNRPGVKAADFSSPGFTQTDDDPVVCVTADDARAYAEWINRQSRQTAYRLPNEAEWEYAARSGTNSQYAWGSTESHACDYGNFGDRSFFANAGSTPQAAATCTDGYVFTAPVFAFSKSKWGLADIVGNVQVWTEGCSHASDAALRTDTWLDNCRGYRVLRGASFATPVDAPYLRIAHRTVPPPSVQATNAWGFRLARSL